MDDIWTMTVRIPREAVADRPMVRHALSVLFGPSEWHELRALPSGRGRVVQVDDLDAAFSAVESLADEQVYYCLNPIPPDCKRANKKVVLSRRWLLVDVDAVKPKEVSSTEEEKVKAATVAGAVLEYLSAQGWPAPIMIDSGNGWHLLYRIDLPNDALSQQILKSFLYALAEKFTSDAGIIDRSTHDAPRVSKLPGTVARKGPDTPDRPHRLCRIVYEPEQLEVVPVELLQRLGSAPQEKPAATNGKHDPWTSIVSNGPGLTSYLKRAIESECLRVALAISDRNIQLNKSAFALGQFAAWPEMSEREAKATLQLAAERAGLLDREIIKTIASGWEAGSKEPRVRPQEPKKSDAGQSLKSLVRGLSKIRRENVDWVWENRIAIGFISIFSGRTSMGKSLVLCDLAARLSRGDSPPFSQIIRPPSRTLFISEDHQETMLAPRLLAAGAVSDRNGEDQIFAMTFEAMAQYTLDDEAMLDRAYLECGSPLLVVMDPPSNFLGKRDEHHNADMRQVLMGLVGWIIRRKVALVLLNNLNKQVGKGLDSVERIMGSVAWAAVARMTVAFNTDPDNPGQIVMGGTKNNLGPNANTLAFTTENDNGTGKVKWIGEVDTSMDDALNHVKKKSRSQNAAEWLVQRFREQSSWPSDDLYALARAAGVHRNAIFEAKDELPIKARQVVPQDGKPRYWEWRAVDGWPPPEKSNETLETLKPCPPKSNDSNIHGRVSMSDSDRDSASIRDSAPPY
jgi:hypothetical protein